jgi:lysophospholipase L1-like esterase
VTRSRALPILSLAVLLSECGSPSTMGPTPTGSLSAVVFYDQNGNGVIDADENVRFPGADLTVGTLSGRTQERGQVTIAGIPDGMASLLVTEESLPPYYTMDSPVTVQVPQETANPVPVPITLSIGTNTPNAYMAFGDSITIGDGSTSGDGYRGPLQSQLQTYLGAASILDQGVEATRTNKGATRVLASLQQSNPAFVLIHYGTNDWNEHECQVAPPCYTITNLQFIVETAKSFNSFPFLATIIPVNVGYDQRVPPERQTWVHNQDALIRQLAAQENVVLVDLEAAFLKAFAENGGNYQVFFSDHIHPSDLGYAIMVKTFFEAITQRAPASASLEAFALKSPAELRGTP